MRWSISQLSFCLLVLCWSGQSIGQAATTNAIQPPGIVFFKGSWNNAVAEAKRQNKPIYLDVYTTWCPPCRRMAREAFPNPKIGEKYNVHFINYQLDAERGEGIDIARRYGVASYPTGLFISPNGELAHRAVGYGGVTAMINQADHVLTLPHLKSTVAKGDKDYSNGRRDPAFLKKYITTRQELQRPVDDVLDAYLDALPAKDQQNDQTALFVANVLQSATTKAFDYLLKMYSSVSPNPFIESDRAIVVNALNRALDNDFKRACATADAALLESIISHHEHVVAATNPDQIQTDAQKQELADTYRQRYREQTQNRSVH